MTRLQPYFNPGPDPDDVGAAASTWAACSGAPAPWPGRWRTGSSAIRPTPIPRYLKETCLPALAEGARSAGRDLEADGFETVIGTSVITGASAEAVDRERERQRRLLAFLYSTPAYAPTLELYGWDDLGPRLRELIRRDRWDDLGDVLSDEVLDTLVPSGTFDELPAVLRRTLRRPRPGHRGVGRRPTTGDDEAFAGVVAALRAGVSGPGVGAQRGMGKMSSSAAMASTAAAGPRRSSAASRSAEARTRGRSAMSPGVQNAWTPGVDRAKWMPRSDLVVGRRRLVPRRRPALAPSPGCRRRRRPRGGGPPRAGARPP